MIRAGPKEVAAVRRWRSSSEGAASAPHLTDFSAVTCAPARKSRSLECGSSRQCPAHCRMQPLCPPSRRSGLAATSPGCMQGATRHCGPVGTAKIARHRARRGCMRWGSKNKKGLSLLEGDSPCAVAQRRSVVYLVVFRDGLPAAIALAASGTVHSSTFAVDVA